MKLVSTLTAILVLVLVSAVPAGASPSSDTKTTTTTCGPNEPCQGGGGLAEIIRGLISTQRTEEPEAEQEPPTCPDIGSYCPHLTCC